MQGNCRWLSAQWVFLLCMLNKVEAAGGASICGSVHLLFRVTLSWKRNLSESSERSNLKSEAAPRDKSSTLGY